MTFAYPYAFPPTKSQRATQVVDLLRGEGFRSNVTTRIGRVRPNDNPYLLRRLPINGCDDLALFGAKLAGAYDWMEQPQKIVKWVKARRKVCVPGRLVGRLGGNPLKA